MSTRTLRLGTSGEDVRDVQNMLQQAGFDPGPANAVFGQKTHDAVVSFQRAKGLAPDGAVGPLTRAALVAATLQGPSGSTAKGMSVHIGVNHVDPAAYPFPVPPLRGCHNDANAMRALALERGFTAQNPLLDAAATSEGVTAAIRQAANALGDGDIFFLTYAGHGSYMPDTNADEADARDETWVLYDRQLLDDELYALWGAFHPGVRIMVLSDSCHSGTVTRFLPLPLGSADPGQLATFEEAATGSGNGDGDRGGIASDERSARTAPQPVWLSAEAADHLALCVASTVPAALGTALGTRPSPLAGARIAKVVKQLFVAPQERSVEEDEPQRVLDPGLAAYDKVERAEVYAEAKERALTATPPQSRRILLISGCQDNQTSGDGAVNGLFTSKLLYVLSPGYVATNGAASSYADLHRRILAEMPSRQTPNLYWAVERDPAFEQQVPFTI